MSAAPMMMRLLFWMLVAHSLADFPLQGEYLAGAKRGERDMPWWIAMTAHSLIHAGAVALITGSFVLAALEFGAHWTIDFLKCRGSIGFTTDQGLHVLCKIVWAAVA